LAGGEFSASGVSTNEMAAATVAQIHASGGASALGDLSDVDTSGASVGDLLEYDGTNWVSVLGAGKIDVSMVASDTMNASSWNFPDWDTETHDDLNEFTVTSDEVLIGESRWVNCKVQSVIDDIDLPNTLGTEYAQIEFYVTGIATNRYTGILQTAYKDDGTVPVVHAASFYASNGDSIKVRIYVKAADGDQQAKSARWTIHW